MTLSQAEAENQEDSPKRGKSENGSRDEDFEGAAQLCEFGGGSETDL